MLHSINSKPCYEVVDCCTRFGILNVEASSGRARQQLQAIEQQRKDREIQVMSHHHGARTFALYSRYIVTYVSSLSVNDQFLECQGRGKSSTCRAKHN